MSSHERLKTARERAGYETAADAARRFGWSESTYRSAENGTRPPSKKKVVEYARAFRVAPEWILFGTGGDERRGVPLVGHVGVGAEVFPINSGGSVEEIDPPPGVGPGAVAVMICGDAMWPRYSDGDILIYDEHRPLSAVAGRECIIELEGGRRMVKTLRVNPDLTCDLESWNAPPIRDVKIAWVAEIKWVKRRG